MKAPNGSAPRVHLVLTLEVHRASGVLQLRAPGPMVFSTKGRDVDDDPRTMAYASSILFAELLRQALGVGVKAPKP